MTRAAARPTRALATALVIATGLALSTGLVSTGLVPTGLVSPAVAAAAGTAATNAATNAAPPGAALTLLAAVVSDDGGSLIAADVTLTAVGVLGSLHGVEGAPAVTDAAVHPGAYALDALPVDGYAVAGLACWSDRDRAEPLAVDRGVLALASGDRAVCEIVLDDVPGHPAAEPSPEPVPSPAPVPVPEPAPDPPRLTLGARVVADDGGDAAAADWILRADGPVELDGAAGAIVDVPVAPGDYALSSSGPAGHRDLGWSCTAGVLVGSTLTLAAGERAACTVVHDDLPVDLALTLDDGGARAANGGAFGLAVGVRNAGARAVDLDEPVAVTVQLPPGTSLDSAPAVCVADGRLVTCALDPAALAIGAAAHLSLTARFHDTATAGVHTTVAVVRTQDDPEPPAPGCASGSNGVDCEGTELRYPTITLVQVLTTDDGGDATSADFSLTATGPAHIAGASGATAVTVAAVPAGTYRLGAVRPAGYVAGGWSCLGAAVEGDAVTIAGIVDVTCTIGHDDRPVDLRVSVHGDEVAPAGGEARFSLVVANAGARGVDADEPVTVVHSLPTGMDYVSGPAACSAAGSTVACGLDPAALAPGAVVTLDIVVAVAPRMSAGSVESRAIVTTEDDPAPPGGCEAPSNNVACAQTRVVVGTVSAQTSVRELVNGAWVASDGAVGFGDRLQFRILVRAGGDAPSTGVGIVDRLPSGLLIDGIARCSVPCRIELDAATGTQRVEIGTMEPGDVVTVTITARVPGVPSQADGTIVRIAFDSAPTLSSDAVRSAPTNVVTVRASHALPVPGRSGGEIPIGGIGVALGLLVAGGLLLVRSRELAAG